MNATDTPTHRLLSDADRLDRQARDAKTPAWREACAALADKRRQQAAKRERRQAATW